MSKSVIEPAWHDAGMDDPDRRRREADLASYYDSELHVRLGRGLPQERVARREAFLDLLRRERRRSVLEIGSGPGRDGQAIASAGFSYTGVDLAPESVARCRSVGLDVFVASVLDLPFEDRAFDAGWTMSTLLHVADADLDSALAELVRVLRPGAPLAVGLWGAATAHEGPWGDDAPFGPQRFFSIRTDEVVRAALGRHGSLEQWDTWTSAEEVHYQWAILRTAASA
jgi:SAM-dependent methyltransferase